MERRVLHAIWAAVIVSMFMLLAAVIVVVTGHDFTVVFNICLVTIVPLLSIFGALIYHRVGRVELLSNGNLSRVMDQNAAFVTEHAAFMKEQQDKMFALVRELQAQTQAVRPDAGSASIPEIPQ